MLLVTPSEKFNSAVEAVIPLRTTNSVLVTAETAIFPEGLAINALSVVRLLLTTVDIAPLAELILLSS